MNDSISFSMDFIGIGAAKAGTTWLATCLSEHPQVCFSKQKELNFYCSQLMQPELSSNYPKGLDWLKKQFDHWNPLQLRGEISPSYLVDADTPEMIYKHWPDAKLIVLFRNPVDTLHSFYYERAKYYNVSKSFEQYLIDEPHALQFGYYHAHLERFQKFFNRKQFHFIIYEDIQSDPNKVLQDLFEFLGIDSQFSPSCLKEKINTRMSAKSPVLRNVIGWGHKTMNATPMLRRFKNVMANAGLEKAVNIISAWNLKPSYYDKLNPVTASRLIQLYERDIVKLSTLLEKDLTTWIRTYQPKAR